MSLIPTTILTGFLGAGKTTLLQRVLNEAHGQKIAVIENEFGEESIDNELLVTETKEQIIQLNNGCICCTIREDLRSALVTLAEKKRSGELDFDRVVLETTGVADPGPVAQTFFLDEDVAENFMLDSVITLVDAKHAQKTLDERIEAQQQVGFADQLFISKADLITPEELADLQHRLKHMNPRAPQRVVHFGEVPLNEVLDLRGFNLSATLEIDPEFLKEEDDEHEHHEHCCGGHGQGHCCGGDGKAGHKHHDHEHHGHCSEHGEGQGCGCSHGGHHHHHSHHDDDVKSFVFRSLKPFDVQKLEYFLGGIIEIYGPKMLRYKGVLNVQGTDHKVIFQGVHQVMGSDLGPQWGANEPRETRMVFIGIELPKEILMQGLLQCLVV